MTMTIRQMNDCHPWQSRRGLLVQQKVLSEMGPLNGLYGFPINIAVQRSQQIRIVVDYLTKSSSHFDLKKTGNFPLSNSPPSEMLHNKGF
uniref:Uncharacterized protein n=1 Tax=Romanomermis culicivorax TaxID=13658 RepID=A0A915K6U6_ROMCU